MESHIPQTHPFTAPLGAWQGLIKHISEVLKNSTRNFRLLLVTSIGGTQRKLMLGDRDFNRNSNQAKQLLPRHVVVQHKPATETR
jgi:hypothetical protein